MSIEQKIAELVEESKKLSVEEVAEIAEETLTEEEFNSLSEEDQAERLDELSPELKQKYADKVAKKLASKKGSRDHDAYIGRTYTGRETSDMFHRGEKLDKHLTRVNKMKEELTVDVSEDVTALIAGEELTEEFKAKAATIFEAAVVTRVKQEVAKLEEEFDTKLEEQVEVIKEGLVEKVDGYLNYVVEQWMTDNELALESGMKSEILESFVAGMKGLFNQHYIEVPDEKFDVLGEMQEQVEEVTSKLDEQLAANVELTKQLNEMKRVSSIVEFSTDMADTDAEKFKGLAEELAFEDADTFKTKLQTIKENYFGKKKSTTVESVVTDAPVTLTEEVAHTPQMSQVLRVLNSMK